MRLDPTRGQGVSASCERRFCRQTVLKQKLCGIARSAAYGPTIVDPVPRLRSLASNLSWLYGSNRASTSPRYAWDVLSPGRQ